MPKYAELRPSELCELWGRGAPAIVPWGALEWHGEHLPLGLDGLVAEAFCADLADRVQGVLLPGIWLPITTLPHQSSLQVRTEALRMILDDTLAGLYAGGARRIALVTGHYAQGHLIELFEAAMRAMDDYEGLLVFAGAPLQLLGEAEVLDHAAQYETSQLLAIRPDLVRREFLPEAASPTRDAVLGHDPRASSAEEGRRLIDQGVEAWAEWLAQADAAKLERYYAARFDELQPYVDAYYEGSWEEAILKWWKEKDA